MSRRTIKKLLRRAEEAMLDERFADAEAIYRRMFDAFNDSAPSLLDHAGCIYGLVRALFLLNRDSEATALAESAIDVLSVPRETVQLAA